MALLAPKYSAVGRTEHRKRMEEHFLTVLNDRVKENEHRQDPYYLVYKLKCQKCQAGRPLDELCFVSEILPPKQNGSFCYKVDNKSGSKELLWVIDP
jgi:hypothetical protein